MSNAAFAIVAIAVRVTSPNGGEVWRPGTFHNITWTTVGSVPQVTLQYSTNGGTSWKAIVASFPNGGSYNWTVPNDISRTCLVRVSDAADSVPSDVSDSLFAIDNMTAVLAGRTPVVTGITAFGPNPVRGTLAVEFGLARPMAVAGYVHSMDGRLVRDLGQSQRPAGCYSLVWDCASEAGRRVQAGTYVVTLRLGNDVQRKLVTVAR